MQLAEKILFEDYQKSLGNALLKRISEYQFSENQIGAEYAMQSSAVFSSNIEGNSIDLNSYMNAKFSASKFKKTKELQEIDDLVSAYQFAKENPLNEENFLKSHHILSPQLLIKSLRGKYRNDKVGVFGNEGLIYLAIEAEFLAKEMKLFFEEIETLLKTELSVEENFYFASFIHLKFVHLHPFRDGNGRAARLLEKWFLTQKLGEKYWELPSERYYKTNQKKYYSNINLGIHYYILDYQKSLPFLLMLPNCFTI